jgi:plasmid stability protein
MTLQTITLTVPDILYSSLKKRAEQANRTVEAELLDVLATAVPVAEELPADLEAALSPLALLDDESLWRAARSRLAPEAAADLESLHLKRQREGLTAAETETLAGLVRQYERAMLVRAQAAALLKQRGHDVSSLVAPG